MKINIQSKDIELSDSVYTYIHEKLHKSLEKYTKSIAKKGRDYPQHSPVEAWVEVGRITSRQGQRKGDVYRAEIQVKLPGSQSIRAEETDWNLHQAIDRVQDDIERQLKEYKGKQRARFERGRRALKQISNISPFARLKRDKRGRRR